MGIAKTSAVSHPYQVQIVNFPIHSISIPYLSRALVVKRRVWHHPQHKVKSSNHLSSSSSVLLLFAPLQIALSTRTLPPWLDLVVVVVDVLLLLLLLPLLLLRLLTALLHEDVLEHPAPQEHGLLGPRPELVLGEVEDAIPGPKMKAFVPPFIQQLLLLFDDIDRSR